MRRLLVSVLLLVSLAHSQGTRTWTQSSYDQFQKGTTHGVAIRSDGTLELAPTFLTLFTTPSTYLWDVAADEQGNVFAAAGSPARVYRIAPDGKNSIVFQPEELQVQALILSPDGTLYAATSPDGKVYRIERKKDAGKEKDKKPETKPAAAQEPQLDPAYASSVFFDPKTKYIWDMAMDKEGRLYVATGDRGEIFRVTKTGESSVFFKSDEAHIRVLQFDAKGNLLAGSDGSGLIYRISPAGEAFVLYSAPKKEITALAIDSDGNIFAAGVGDKRPSGAATPATINLPQPQPGPGAPQQPPPGPIPLPAMGAAGSEIYRIEPDGSPRRVWRSREDIIYALMFDNHGRLLAGSGNRGHVFEIRGDDEFTDLVKASATQVTAFARGKKGVYACTSNLGKVFLLGDAPEPEGSFESEVFDADVFSRWGRAEVRGAGSYEFFARSGNVDNPDRNWSPWSRVALDRDGMLEVPPARFVQWRTILKPAAPPPRIESVTLNYRSRNVKPVVEEITVQVGARILAQPKPSSETISIGGNQPPRPRVEMPIPAQRDRNYISARWTVHDDNDDDLEYSVYYRGDGESRWKLLKDKLSDNFYSWEIALLPDGGYTLKIVATDAPSHSPDEALTTEKESQRFEVDSTPPRVEELLAVAEAGGTHVTFRATDGFSVVRRAEYSVDAGPWEFVEPVGQIADSKTENYDFTIPVPGAPADGDKKKGSTAAAGDDEHVIVVRVFDAFENMVAAKTIVRPAMPKKK